MNSTDQSFNLPEIKKERSITGFMKNIRRRSVQDKSCASPESETLPPIISNVSYDLPEERKGEQEHEESKSFN